MRSLLAVSLALTASLLPACGPVGVGGECHYVGDTNGCVEGALCTPARSEPVSMGQDPTWDTAICRVICNMPSDCPVGEECRAVAGFEWHTTCQPIEETP